MKKALSFIFAAILIISSLALTSFAAGTENENFEIPKAVKPPVIDGKIDGNEWDNALVRTLTKDNVTDVTNTDTSFQGATFRWMWDDAGLYLFAEINDSTAPEKSHEPNAGSYNSGDGIQVCIYASDEFEGANVTNLFFYSLIPQATDGNPYIGEHFVYGDGGSGIDVPASEAKIASVVSGSSYTIEAFIAKESLAKSDPAIVIAEDAVLPLANIVMDQDGATQALFTDTAWFSGINSNKYKLVNTEAGAVEVEDIETPTEPTPEAPTPETPAPTAPQTNDTLVVFVAAALISLVIVSVMRKRVAR